MAAAGLHSDSVHLLKPLYKNNIQITVSAYLFHASSMLCAVVDGSSYKWIRGTDTFLVFGISSQNIKA